jgi:glutamate carboxypeptidase
MLQHAIAAARRRAENALPVLERWVRQNSYSSEIDHVNAAGALLREDFAFADLEVKVHPGRDVGDHLVWHTPAFARGGKERVLLIGHHDTVFPPGSFERWEVDGDILRGPGVLDMKGGLVTVWAALGALSEVGALAEVPVALVSVGDEEIGSPESQPMLRDLAANVGAALVFEAGRAEDRIITRRKGTGGMRIAARGRAAHAGNYHAEGRNAIWAIARFIDAAQRLTDYDRGVTVNVGTVAGGEARNTVPAHAECGIDFRFERGEDGRALVEAVRQAAQAIAEETEIEIEVSGGVRRDPLERSEASGALCKRYAACARAAGLGGEEAGLLGGGSDANTVSAVGVPAIDGLGPRGFGFHTHDEYIEISSLPLRAEALVRFLLR